MDLISSLSNRILDRICCDILPQIHYKIKCQRHDFTHKASSSITKNYLFVGVENLNIAGMMKNRCLAKAIQDQGWGMFINQLQYKSLRNGGLMVKIDRFAPSTKTCNHCKHKQPMPLEVRIYDCHNCGHLMDRDLNAANNIDDWTIEYLNRCGTHQIQACGSTSGGDILKDISSYVGMKQEKFQSLGLEAATECSSS